LVTSSLDQTRGALLGLLKRAGLLSTNHVD
jgi:hypothetical protein